MAHGYCQRIRRIEVLRLVGQRYNVLQHFKNLFFAGVAVAGDGLLYFFGRILRNRHAAGHSGGNGNALRPAQLEHALHIFAKERRFNGKFVGAVLLHQVGHFFMDQLQPFVIVAFGLQLQHIYLDDLYGALLHFNDAVPHDERAGINA